jgi:RNA polymerase sigma-70 factor (ECF subfamily)
MIDKQVQEYISNQNLDQAFRLVLSSFQEQVYWQCRRMLISHENADDVCQNTFIKVWKNLGKFRFESKLSSWVFRICHNECINWLNKEKRNLSETLDESLIKKTGDDGFGFSGNDIELKLQRAILSLPDKQRAVFNYRYFEEKPFKEISEIMETSEGGLKANYHHAVKKIEAFLKLD